MITRGRRGSALLLTLFLLMVVFTLGAGLVSLTTGGLMRSRDDMLRAQALDATEAGVEAAISQWRKNGTLPQDGATGSLSATCGYIHRLPTDGAGGSKVIDCTGWATLGPRTMRRRLQVPVTRDVEDLSVWDNVIFGGVGQAGKSINGNVVMRGKVHLLGDGEPYTDVDHDGHWDDNEPYTDLNHNGQYDIGEPFTDLDHDGHRDAREPFTDINGNGICDPPLTVTELAEDISGNANIGNNYSGMSNTLRSLLPSCPTQSFGGETVESLSAKLRVKHGRVNISGSATVGDPNVTGGSPAVKETMNGVYVSDGFGGTAGTAHVYSDNGYSHGYDLNNLKDANGNYRVRFPDVVSPVTIDGVNYDSHMAYLSQKGLHILGTGNPPTLDLKPTQSFSASDASGDNSISVDGNSGTLTIKGIVYVEGDLVLDKDNGNKSYKETFKYSGRGTLVAAPSHNDPTTGGNIYVHSNLLPSSCFPDPDAIGLCARHRLELATGGGDSQLTLAGAFYAQEKVVSGKQNEIGGTFVSSYFEMTNVPHMFQVPKLAYWDPVLAKYPYLPPGLPGAAPILAVQMQVGSAAEVAPQ
jgi:hypothetical protein